jgi:O-antigen biosynthesis protein
MKIAFLLPANVIAGGAYVAYRQAHYLAENGHEVTVAFSSLAQGRDVEHYPDFSLPTYGIGELVVARRRFDVVVATWWETFYDMFAIEADRYLYFCQSDERRFYDVATHFELPFVERTYCDPRIGVITEAQWILEWLERDYGATVEYAPNGIDTTLFRPDVTPHAPRGPRVRVLIEGPGKTPHKRVDLAFRVARRLRDSEVWYASSDGFVDPSWRCDRVFKHVSLQSMPAIYASCDVLLKLSTVEGVFGPPLEMMACGGTAVVSKVTGYSEYIRHGENALVVELDDEDAASRALTRLIEDPALRARLSAAGLATARMMDWRDRSPLFEKGLMRLLERTRPLPQAAKVEYRLLDELRRRSNRHEAKQTELLNWAPLRVWTRARRWLSLP